MAIAYAPARVRGVRGHELGRLRARCRGRARASHRRRAAPRAHAAARARAALQPPERPLRDLRRRRLRARARWRSPRSRSARSGSTRALTGHRFLFGTVRSRAQRPGAWTSAAARSARAEIARAARRRRRAAGASCCSPARVQDRLDGVGVLNAGRRRRGWAPSGPRPAPPACAATRAPTPTRCCGTAASRPRYPRSPSGDVAARAEIRAPELEHDLRHPRRAARRGRPSRAPPHPQRRTATVRHRQRVESPRGRDRLRRRSRRRRRIARLHLRTGSYANWPVLAHAVPGNLLPDFPLINKSFELCYACADR